MDFDASAIQAFAPVAGVSPVDGRTRVDTTTAKEAPPARGAGDRDALTGIAGDDTTAKSAVDELNSSLEPYGVSLKFHRDEDTSAIVIEVVDARSGEELRQIPNEAALKLAAEFTRLQGRIFNKQV